MNRAEEIRSRLAELEEEEEAMFRRARAYCEGDLSEDERADFIDLDLKYEVKVDRLLAEIEAIEASDAAPDARPAWMRAAWERDEEGPEAHHRAAE